MKLSVPYREESDGQGTHKRTYWPKGDANAKFDGVKKAVSAMTSKRGKLYSSADQGKIAQEKWGEFCESHPEWRGG
jgi:hypothetical protein